MKYLENDFAQLEHINQIIANNLHHESWDCFDTTELLKQYPHLGTINTTDITRSFINIPDGVRGVRGEVVNEHHQIRYNSFIVTIKHYWELNENGVNTEYTKYTFEIRNSLWDGNYKLFKSYKTADGKFQAFSDAEKKVTIGYDDKTNEKNSNLIIIRLSGPDRNRIRVCFHMTMAGQDRQVLVENLQLILDNGVDFTHKFDQKVTESGKVALNNGKNANNVTVTIRPCDKTGKPIAFTPDTVGPYIQPDQAFDVSSEFTLTYSETSVPGDYYCLMEAYSNINNIKAADSKIIHVHKVQDEKLVIDWGDENNYKNVYKGSKHTFTVYFNIMDEYNVESNNKKKMIGTPVNFTFIERGRNKRTTYSAQIKKDSKGKYYASTTISYRKYYEEYSYLEVEVSSAYGLGRVMDEKVVKHPWFIAHNYTELLGQMYLVNSNGKYVDSKGNILNGGDDVTQAQLNDNGTDWIFLEPKKYDVTKPFKIVRELTLAGLTGKTHCILDGGNTRNIIETYTHSPSQKNKLRVNLVGLSFQNAQKAIHSGAGTRLLIERCYFTGNYNTAEHEKGCSVYIPDDDYSNKHPELWDTEIRNSYFKNNRGNEFQSVGTSRMNGNLFVTTSASFLQQPEVKVVSVRAGSVEYKNNTSYINSGNKAMPSNHSCAKALAYVDRDATFNGKGPKQLQKDMSLPLYGKWGNKAYTYAIYYYPYENVRTEIVCSPRRGHEREATGHRSSIEDWTFYDGYYFVRWNKGRNKGNTRDPWTKEELAIPDNLGIYENKKDGKFITNYDPRVSKAKSVTSTYD